MDYTSRLEHKEWYTGWAELDEANEAYYHKSPTEMTLIQLREEVEAAEREHLAACDTLEVSDENDGEAVELARKNVDDAYWKMFRARERYSLAFEMAY